MSKSYLLPGALLLAACSHSEPQAAVPTIDFGPNGGITYRDPANRPTGATDPTDWTTDAPWNDTERGLFSSIGLPLDGVLLPAGTWQITAFANPTTRPDGITFGAFPNTVRPDVPTTATRLSAVIVDAHYQVIFRADEATRQQSLYLPLQLEATKYGAPAMYRLYYVIYDAQRVYFRGHGDFRLDS